MYKSNEKQIMISDDFLLPFGGKLDKENRWVKLTTLIPWWVFEDKYRENFKPRTINNLKRKISGMIFAIWYNYLVN